MGDRGGKPKTLGEILSGASVENLQRVPCLRNSLMTGIGCGFLMGAHKYRMYGIVMRACDWAVGTFCLTSGVTWLACSTQYNQKKQTIIAAFEKAGIKPLPPPGGKAGPGGASPGAAQ